MTIININKILKEYDYLIVNYAKKIKGGEWEDHSQNMRIYLCEHIDKFDVTKSTLSYYIQVIVMTGYRREIYDERRQAVFENSFSYLDCDSPSENSYSYYFDIINAIVVEMGDVDKTTVLFSILYNKDKKTHIQISKSLDMPYKVFCEHLETIKKVMKEYLKIYR